jgi:hypothetical protein
MAETQPSVCDSCRHRITDVRCAAYTLIPERYLLDQQAHTTVQDDQDRPLVWEFAPGTQREFQRWERAVLTG